MPRMTRLLVGFIGLVPVIGLGLATQLYAALASYAPSLGASWSPFGPTLRLYPPWQLVVWALGDGPLSARETLLASAPAGLSLAVALTMWAVVVRAKRSSDSDGSLGLTPQTRGEVDPVQLADPYRAADPPPPLRPANIHQELSARRAHERVEKRSGRHAHIEDDATRRLSPHPAQPPSVVVDSSLLEPPHHGDEPGLDAANPWEPDIIVTPQGHIQERLREDARQAERGVTPRDNPFASTPPPVPNATDDEKVNPFEARTVVATEQDSHPFIRPGFEEDEVRVHRVSNVDKHDSEQVSRFDPPTADYDLASQTRRLGTEEMEMLEGIELLDGEDGEGRS